MISVQIHAICMYNYALGLLVTTRNPCNENCDNKNDKYGFIQLKRFYLITSK